MKRICYGVFGITFSLASHAIVYTTSTEVGNYSTAGLEGFYIDYQKPSLSLDDQGGMGSVIGSVTHNYSNFFLGLDGRGSWGKWRYNSAADGTISGVPQAEYEVRAVGGHHFVLSNDSFISTYAGFGYRNYEDNSDGKISSYGYYGFKRTLNQTYIPIGVTYLQKSSTHSGLFFAPNVEVDPVFWGNVRSYLNEVNPILPVINNTQKSGIGVRGEFNFGKEPQKGKPGWNIAPFVRYWHINQSNYEGSSNEYVDVSSQEPTNNWVEVGAAFSLLFE